jgi:opacity protein-like surface antigen
MVLILGLSAQAAAEDAVTDEDVISNHEHYFEAKHILGVGLAYQKADSELRASVRDLVGIKVDLDDLGVDDSELSGAIEYRWRFAPRWTLVGLAYRFDESGDQTVKRDFNFDGQEFTAGLSVDTGIKIDTYILDVVYSVYRSDTLQVLVGGGIHAFDLEASIQAKVDVDDQSRQGEAAVSELLAPLPNLRLQMLYKLPGNWGFGFAAGWLSAKYDNYDGSFAYIHPRLAYAFGNRWAVTAGYQYADIELTRSRSNGRELEFNTAFQGPTLFLTYRF